MTRVLVFLFFVLASCLPAKITIHDDTGTTDADRDGVAATEDCDDLNSAAYPGADEVCGDLIDNDCNGEVDDLDLCDTGELPPVDADEDGYTEDEDCNDEDPFVYPGATELCDGKDNDCNEAVDDVATAIFYRDADEDTYGDADDSLETSSCDEQPAGYVGTPDDCDDTDPSVYPNADEFCNGEDDDCDGTIDEDAVDPQTWYGDFDGDSYGDPGDAVDACEQPANYVDNADDCDPGDATVNPAADELCLDGIDNDCNVLTDDAAGSYWYADTDGDSYGDPTDAVASCDPIAGRVLNADDCNDGSAAINPAASETCNSTDDDCDGSTDEGVTTTYYDDDDGDTYGDPADTTAACSAPAGYVATNTDCDDTDSSIYPTAPETCDGDDDDCDGSTDEGVTTTYYADDDGDTYGDPADTTADCAAPVGYVADNTDCNDASGTVHPGATESCNSVDDDCDGSTDEGVQTTYYRDADGDTYGTPSTTSAACSAPAGYVANADDCNDGSAAINPAASETCNSTDDDCDGSTDEGVTTTYYDDDDGDTYGDPADTTAACSAPAGYVATNTDCDDTDSSIYPTAPETCDGEDEDCDGTIDDGFASTTYYADDDGDAYGDPSDSTSACVQPPGYVTDNTDCDDADVTEFPGAIWWRDRDADNYGDSGSLRNQCEKPAGYVSSTFGDDCDDYDATIHPGAADSTVNGTDEDCDGTDGS